MAARKVVPMEKIDELLRGLLVLTRSVDHILETSVVEKVVDLPLSFSMIQLLRLLGQRDKQTSTQLAHSLKVSKPAVTQMVDTLVRKKLVVRKTAKADRREVNLSLTVRGREVYNKIRRAQRQCIRNVVTRLPPKKIDNWIDTMVELTGDLVKTNQQL